jgi:uncharacterized MnhB-related membrane protein
MVEKNLLPLLGIEPRLISHPARNLVVPTELSQLLVVQYISLNTMDVHLTTNWPLLGNSIFNIVFRIALR